MIESKGKEEKSGIKSKKKSKLKTPDRRSRNQSEGEDIDDIQEDVNQLMKTTVAKKKLKHKKRESTTSEEGKNITADMLFLQE